MFRAHELIAALDPAKDGYAHCVAAVKFDLGDMWDVLNLAEFSTQTFFEIPAPICLFQVTNKKDLHFFLARQDYGGIVWNCFHRSQSDGFQWVQEDVEFFIEADGRVMFATRISENKVFGKFSNGEEIIDNSNEMTETERWTLEKFIIVAMSIEVFSCSNVTTIENKPPKHINSKRIKKGKIPFFSYRTLHITNSGAGKAEAKGGSHASPRLHLRRGHIRRLPNGNRIWVTACLVGDKSKGFVSHDYDVQAQTAGGSKRC